MRLLSFLLLFLWVSRCGGNQQQCVKNTKTGQCVAEIANYTVPHDCGIVMSVSELGGWGLFTLRERARGTQVMDGDIVIHINDVIDHEGMIFFLKQFVWRADEIGGLHEGHQVASVVPGLPMLTNLYWEKHHNAIHHQPDRDDANCSRETSPGAGCFTQYHNFTWYYRSNVEAGDEILINHSIDYIDQQEWFQGYEDKRRIFKSVEWLRENGVCVDNIKPGNSKVPHAGRGAFARRRIYKNMLVAPIPLVPIFNGLDTLYVEIIAGEEKAKVQKTWQLLMTYMYSHRQSTLMLFPYGPYTNLINHSRDKANVRLQWSQKSRLFREGAWLRMSVEDLEKATNRVGLLMDLVAVRDIEPGEEILIDYGPLWHEAWEDYAEYWKPRPQYTPPHVMDEVVAKLRTVEEQKQFPYPSNMVTSCFYPYNHTESVAAGTTVVTAKTKEITAAKWKMARHTFDWQHLRPCSILKRSKDEQTYTVRILNRPGMKGDIRVPRGSIHLVENVPRAAIRFTDKVYTTDQHIDGAFRFYLEIPDEIFPPQWKNIPNKKHDEEDMEFENVAGWESVDEWEDAEVWEEDVDED